MPERRLLSRLSSRRYCMPSQVSGVVPSTWARDGARVRGREAGAGAGLFRLGVKVRFGFGLGLRLLHGVRARARVRVVPSNHVVLEAERAEVLEVTKAVRDRTH